MKKHNLLRLLVTLLVAIFLSACSTGEIVDPTTVQDTQIRIEDNTEIMPETVLQIGDSFEYYPRHASGHLSCTVTGVRLISSEADCPIGEDLLSHRMVSFYGDEEKAFEYEEWFTPGGAYDHGCRLILVDITVTNIDALGWLDDGTNSPTCGIFLKPYVFRAAAIVHMVDLDVVYGDPRGNAFSGFYSSFFSEFEKYSENIPESWGDERFALEILPGQTVSYTLGYSIAGIDGKAKDLSKLMLCVGSDSYAETGTFIDLGLGDDDA